MSAGPGADGLAARLGRLRPTDVPGWILLGLVIAGLLLRGAAALSWWPATTTLSDSWPYAFYAGDDPFENPQHPGGYSVLLAVVGQLSHEVAVPILLQHLLGIGSALALFAAVRRLTGSAWAGLVPAAAVLLNADQVFLEHSIMSEAPFVFAVSLSLYCCVRVIDDPAPWWRWPLLAGAGLALATTIRSAGLFLIPVAIAALLLSRPRPWRPRWPAVGAIAGAATAILLVFASANAISTGRFEIGPTQGWHLYQRVAPFADCSRFDPPEGTGMLCEDTPAVERPAGDFYLFDPDSPAVEEFGFVGEQDGLVGSWARRAALAQPGDLVNAVWDDLSSFYVPSRRQPVPYSGGELDPQLDWSSTIPPDAPEQAKVERDTQAGMELFFNDFTVDEHPRQLVALHDYQRVFRFGPTMLSIATLLALLGLFVGPRRSRAGVLLFGLGGLALLVAPVIGGTYVGRYAVPLAGPLMAAAAITVVAIWRMESARRFRARSARA